MNTPAPASLHWEVNGLRMAGLSWGDVGARPLLALHGWLDNAASFSMLAPRLPQHHVVAVDLSGHGRSARRSADATYQIWDDLPELLGVLDGLGWERFALMGHSRGAAIASLLASVIPERVERLVLLDGVVPRELGEDQFPRQLRKFLDEKRHWQQRSNRVYASIDSAVASRSGTSPPPAAVRLLVERNLRPCAGGYTWTTDLRLRGASAVKMTGGQIAAVLDALAMPTLLLLAEEGFGRHPGILEQARQHISCLEAEVMAGGHHFHMESEVSVVARRIGAFLQQ